MGSLVNKITLQVDAELKQKVVQKKIIKLENDKLKHVILNDMTQLPKWSMVQNQALSRKDMT